MVGLYVLYVMWSLYISFIIVFQLLLVDVVAEAALDIWGQKRIDEQLWVIFQSMMFLTEGKLDHQ